MTLTKCMQVVTERRIEVCIGCKGKSCDCCGGSGKHATANSRFAQTKVNTSFVEKERLFRPAPR